MQPCSAVYRSTAHISGVMCFDSSACEVISAALGHHEHLNKAPIVPIAQQESSFLGTSNSSKSRVRWRIVGSHLRAPQGGYSGRQGARKAAGHAGGPRRRREAHACGPQGAGGQLCGQCGAFREIQAAGHASYNAIAGQPNRPQGRHSQRWPVAAGTGAANFAPGDERKNSPRDGTRCASD